ncbi:helix-turn-helix domain-containing protein [Apilactobacillus timberlakei]|uniref:helix-turn-helix domain-containing protein n=1 Tax=Apilactobacillus timberlakei TaxID=2008380 RepID=UPI00112C5A00|nr:helix-turn-helix transcriptional regulator [Apilactobacillus timberlakei]TPR17810.1 XRE family transcriptional regulator [Apilactobacillus timberlakei]TPR18511.1 XRE family transcriptional regulator [Apilactobacillus timberlakei]TPR20358.1 XRE family transcriptional regulator [Apilactobacillus timberlakei]TPR22121.1 XRE family transcriptional regulator [Apilactobacillus timberlakei]
MQKSGALIKKSRITMGITQVELAKRTNCTQTTISNIENGNHKTDMHTISLISDILNIPIESFSNDTFQLTHRKLDKIYEYILDGKLDSAKHCLDGIVAFNIDDTITKGKYYFYSGYITFYQQKDYVKVIPLMLNAYYCFYKDKKNLSYYVWTCSYLAKSYYLLNSYDESNYYINNALTIINADDNIGHSLEHIKDAYNMLHYVLCKMKRFKDAKCISNLIEYRELAFIANFEIILRDHKRNRPDDVQFNNLCNYICSLGIKLPNNFQKLVEKHNLE